MAKRKSRKQRRKAEQLRSDPRRQRKLASVEGKLDLAKREAKKEAKAKRVKVAEAAEITEIPTVAPKPAHPERRPSKVEVLQRGAYAVFVDFNSHSCIRVGAGRDLTYYIPMDSAGLDVHQMAHEKFDDVFKPYNYPLLRAAKLYAESAQSFGYTEKARQHLEAILSGSTSAKEQEMATKKAMTKGSKAKRVIFDPKKMIQKGNPEALKKARGARMVGSATKYEGRTIKKLVKSAEAAGLRKGTGRAKKLDFVLKHTKTDDVLGKQGVTGANLAFMVAQKFIALV